MIRLGVNLDHVATLRNARGGNHPDIVQAAKLTQAAGADGITAHLREDRRHIMDDDLLALKNSVSLPLNMEMAPTVEMLKIASKLKPHACCLVPEKREELTTEGGLNVHQFKGELKGFVEQLKASGILVSFFIDPVLEQVEAAAVCGADIVELHTGTYCLSKNDEDFSKLLLAADMAKSAGLEVHAGHGINYDSMAKIAKLPHLAEVNIGHFIVGEALTDGLLNAIKKMKALLL